MKAKRCWFLGSTTEESCGQLGEFMLGHAESRDRRKPVHLFISSGGGGLGEALAVAELIRSLPIHVEAFAFGDVCSSAVLIYAAARRRWATATSAFMVHPAAIRVDQEQFEIARMGTQARLLGWTSANAVECMKEYLGLGDSAPLIRAMVSPGGELWLRGAGEAIDAGLATDLLTLEHWPALPPGAKRRKGEAARGAKYTTPLPPSRARRRTAS